MHICVKMPVRIRYGVLMVTDVDCTVAVSAVGSDIPLPFARALAVVQGSAGIDPRSETIYLPRTIVQSIASVLVSRNSDAG